MNMGRSVKFEREILTNPLWFTFSRQRRIWSLHVIVLYSTEKKCIINYKLRAKPFYFLLNLLYIDVCVAVVLIREF